MATPAHVEVETTDPGRRASKVTRGVQAVTGAVAGAVQWATGSQGSGGTSRKLQGFRVLALVVGILVLVGDARQIDTDLLIAAMDHLTTAFLGYVAANTIGDHGGSAVREGLARAGEALRRGRSTDG